MIVDIKYLIEDEVEKKNLEKMSTSCMINNWGIEKET